MVNAKAADMPSSLAKFHEDLFKIEGRTCTSSPRPSIPVTNFVADEIVDAKQLPLKFTAYSPCFRSEAAATARTRAA
jgi:seryl-tRNA synthetase